MEKTIEEFSWGLFTWQALIILGGLTIVYLIYKFVTKKKPE